MSTLIAIAVKIVLALLAIQKFFNYIGNTTFVHMFLFIVACQIAGIKKRKEERNESNKRDIKNTN